MRILVLGAGVIGSVIAAKLHSSGHEVAVLARGRRLSELRAAGLVIQDEASGDRATVPVRVVSRIDDERYDLVVVAVRFEQLTSTIPILEGIRGDSDILFFGNTAGRQTTLASMFGERAVFGFPAVGGVRDGPVIRYLLIRQQKTMLGEHSRETTPRLQRLQRLFSDAGFPTRVSVNIEDWMIVHTAFVVTVECALWRVDVDTAKLADDPSVLRLMVQATREAFNALGVSGNSEIPGNLRVLYCFLPTALAVRYWRGVFASPRGELWFGAHTRAAPEEMRAIAAELFGCRPPLAPTDTAPRRLAALRGVVIVHEVRPRRSAGAPATAVRASTRARARRRGTRSSHLDTHAEPQRC